MPALPQEVTSELPQELQKLINDEKRFYMKKHEEFEGTKVPQWPITSTRDEHKDGFMTSVFIGRANNAFGYSTKWNYK